MQLGWELRRLRKNVGFTRVQAVEGLNFSETKLYRVEEGQTALPKQSDLRDLLERYGITDESDVEFLVEIHRDSLNRGWWSAYRSTMPSGMAMYVGLEDGAKTIRSWQPDVVFGLLQTEAYMRAMFTTAKLVDEMTTEFIERSVELRMERKDVLTRENPAEIRVLMDEAALRRQVGSREIMLEQYEELARLAETGNVSIQVLPMGASVYRCSYDFAMLEFEGSLPTVIQMDIAEGGTSISDKDTTVWSFSRRFDALRDGALPVGETPKFLQQLSREI
ncbi:helix-turn-helix domain-containing protein [Streptomyces qinzhouensis]|uniref:Helix-turn-helix domain-containing protein n=2 Tax=Streptomyces qinzhouensis TaxID=2599401 RepID=A0A5B8JSF3_9ACTN|nr:helix-turn-helix domain-containing protein [Streptomyces qinzhouensis]